MVVMHRKDYAHGDWRIFNEDGDTIGLRDDAPDEYKRQYNDYKRAHDSVWAPIKGSCYMEVDGWPRPGDGCE